MIVLGIILLVVGLLLGVHLLFTLGIILIVVGVILELLGAMLAFQDDLNAQATAKGAVLRAVRAE